MALPDDDRIDDRQNKELDAVLHDASLAPAAKKRRLMDLIDKWHSEWLVENDKQTDEERREGGAV
jgi:hypothetical protein